MERDLPTFIIKRGSIERAYPWNDGGFPRVEVAVVTDTYQSDGRQWLQNGVVSLYDDSVTKETPAASQRQFSSIFIIIGHWLSANFNNYRKMNARLSIEENIAESSREPTESHQHTFIDKRCFLDERRNLQLNVNGSF